MLTKTEYNITSELLKELQHQLPNIDFKLTINQPTGDFFYDPWTIKDEHRGTVWEDILKSLPVTQGEARLIVLTPGQAYQSHSDIDNRYHLNIESDNSSYLVNLDTKEMFPILQDCAWYYLDASPRHSAVNFGQRNRIQLVVRDLLKRNTLSNPIHVELTGTSNRDRFLFDDVLSIELNKLNQQGLINNFNYNQNLVKFDIEKTALSRIVDICPKEFLIKYE